MKTIKVVLAFFLIISNVYAGKVVKIGSPVSYSDNNVIIHSLQLKANNVASWFTNTGVFNQDFRTTNTPGLEWPKGSNKFACFTSGLCIGCGINGQYAQVMASYKGEYAPGKVLNGNFYTDADFKMYSVKIGDNSYNNPDYANWYKMVPYGAPWVDKNNNGTFETGIDIPGMKDASQTVFELMTDMDTSAHSIGEGFGGGIINPLLKAEVAWTSWAYSTAGLEDLQFIKWRIINKGTNNWDSTFIGVVVDPDLGDANDDYIGCDTTLDLGFCYNSDNNDPVYGLAPPAFGMDYFRGAVKKNTNDTLGLTSYTFFTSTGAGGPPCESDPNGEPVPAYHMLQGLKKDRSPYIDITQTPRVQTKFCYYGDPETNLGWTEYKGSRQNCGGINGTEIPVNPPGDRRFIFGSGRVDFKNFPGDTQTIIVGQMVARGTDNKSSVTWLKRMSKTAQLIYDSNFDVIPKPPVPYVWQSFTPITPSTCALNIYWNDAAESFYFWDTIFYNPADSNIYEFEGYEIYEVNKNLSNASLPDFSRPTTINPNDIKLVKIYDKRNNLGVIIDTLPTGVVINGNELYSPLPIVPPYGLGMPSEFPNNGLSRLIQINQTLFPGNYGGNSSIQYGQTYKYIVGAYAVSRSTKIRRGFRVVRTTLGSVVFNVNPAPYSNNITFHLHNGDTITNNRIDLGVKPVVVGQQFIQNAKYRIIFNSPDTAYSILKSTNNGVSYTALKTGLKVTSGYYGNAHDSSRIYDGLLFKVDKIRYSGPAGQYVGNFGIIRDPVLPADSIQTRMKGWEYLPVNQYITGSKFLRDVSRPWRSVSMSVSYPNQGTFTNLRSSITPEVLRKVKIVFSNTNKQYAYRFRDTSAANDNYYIYQDMTQVPFKVYDADYLDSSSTPRQLNCAFVESNDVVPANGQWAPGADSLGRKLLLYVFASNYDTSIVTPYKNRNLFLNQSQFDIMFVWSPRLISPAANFTENDSLIFYPYTVTRPGVIYEFSTSAPTVPVIPISTEIPDKYDLMQNYPNPFNPVTNISFKLPENSFVTLKVYNILGQMIKVLINNERLDAGVHQTDFDGSNLSSGIYFYAIQTEKFTQTKRMVLLK